VGTGARSQELRQKAAPSRGAGKIQIDGPPRTFAKSQTHPPTIRLFFSLTFFFSTFLGVSRQGEFKNTIKICLQKVHVKTYFQNFDKKFDVSFSSNFFLFYRVFGCFSATGVQKHYKKRFAKKSCQKAFTKNSTKNPKPTFSRTFFITFFGRFSMRGVQKHDKKNIEKIFLTLVLFRTLTHPPTTGVTDFFLPAPCTQHGGGALSSSSEL
jgi:hypothetical protein